jgi:hypothetical protein
MNAKRLRIIAAVNVWGELLRLKIASREDAINIIKNIYKDTNVEPIRGASSPPDIFDKEMITIYIIGKWGLGLDKEMLIEMLDSLFNKEVMLEKLYNSILQGNSRDEICREIKELCEKLDEALIARELRFAFTLYYFGFTEYGNLVTLLRKIYMFFPEFQETVRRFTKFVIAYEVGSRISSGKIKNDIELNMTKNVIALDIGIPRALPSTSYIVEVSKHFFNLQENILKSLKTSQAEKKENQSE